MRAATGEGEANGLYKEQVAKSNQTGSACVWQPALRKVFAFTEFCHPNLGLAPSPSPSPGVKPAI